MAGCGLGQRMILACVEEDRAVVLQPAQATGQVAVEPGEVIRPHLVHDDEDDEIGPDWRGSVCRRRGSGSGSEQQYRTAQGEKS